MAERRMFAKTIIDSDAFLDMPQSTQLLYFHLSMRADDDGFINNPKSITRNVKCNEDDLKLLALKKFIIPFESGIVVIKHWKIHNYIRNDRYKETKYKEEKSLLFLDENNSYSLGIPTDNQMTTIGIPTDNQMDTQVRIGKDRIDKDIKESNTKVLQKKNENINYQEIVDKYNEICVSLSKVKKISNARKKAINARLKMYSLEEIIEVFTKAEESNFLKGANNINFKANFDWLMSDKNMAKVIEGKYDNDKTFGKNTSYNNKPAEKPKTTNKFNSFSQRQYTTEQLDELERKLLSK
jgi:hypothetical protein